jgi:hypothetical protein
MADKPITVKQRMDAAATLAETMDKKVRVLSRYGDASVDGFDETMAYAGIAHALATWWEHMTEQQVNDRLLKLVQSTKAARHNLVASREHTLSDQPKEGATIQ